MCESRGHSLLVNADEYCYLGVFDNNCGEPKTRQMGMTSSLIQVILHRNWLYSVVVHMAVIKRRAPSHFHGKIEEKLKQKKSLAV